ncbi:MAG TPA: calcium/sodium antiporter [Cyclobacteriaceae bacterium]|nr:calcium/sodium antiporter [Cyclobacteriaceae bacterium]HRJ81067.1 calcium/sodium antiporter [Cyclobacteriaceae bacterium]
MFLYALLLVGGFVILIKGADFLVAGASSLAKRFNVSTLIIGLTVVSFGTSAPEMTVNIINSIAGRNEAIFGNIIGSNMFNLLFILGITGIIYPLVVQKSSVKYEVPFSLIGIVLLWVLVNDQLIKGSETDMLSRTDALILFAGFLAFLLYIYRSLKTKTAEEGDPIREYSIPVSVAMIVGGVGMLIGGGYLVTENAVGIAKLFGLSEKLIGLTILAVGTSLPELATTAVAAFKKQTDIAIGNIIGSNIFNIFLILGVNGMIKPIEYPDHNHGTHVEQAVLNTDLYVLAIGTLALLISMFTLSRNKIDRWEALGFLILYLAYTYYLIDRN